MAIKCEKEAAEVVVIETDPEPSKKGRYDFILFNFYAKNRAGGGGRHVKEIPIEQTRGAGGKEEKTLLTIFKKFIALVRIFIFI